MLYLVIAFGIWGLDQWVKNRVEAREKENGSREILGGRILLRKSHNRGAALNLLEEKQKLVAGWSTALLAGLMGSFLATLGKKGQGLRKMGMALLVGGAASNVYDRLKRSYVVDYFSFQVAWKKLRNVVFNLGDLFILLGSFLVILWNLCRKS